MTSQGRPPTADRVGAPAGPPPTGPLRWVRRRVLPMVARACALAGLALCAAWLTGRVLTDEHAWSQYLWWVPTPWVLAPGVVLLALSAAAGRLATRLGGVIARPFLLVALLAVGGWFALVECRLIRLAPERAGEREPIRIVSWNMASNGMWRGAGDWVAGMHPDVVLLANTPRTKTRSEIIAGFERVIDDAASADPDAPVPTHHARIGRFEVFSRLPILRAGVAGVPLPEGATQGWRAERVPAQLAFVELDASVRGIESPIVVWVVDLPSAPALHRAESMRAAADAARGWNGPERIPDERGGLNWIAPAPAQGQGENQNQGQPRGQGAGFPPADLVVGDFNTPRGSDSISMLLESAGSAGTFRDAHAAAGVGPDWTWTPRFRFVPEWAWWAIDLAFAGPGVRVIGFDAAKPPSSGREQHDHHAVVVDVVGAADGSTAP